MSDFFDPDEWESKPAPRVTSPVIPVATVATPAAAMVAEVKQAFFELKPVGQQPKIEVEVLEAAVAAVPLLETPAEVLAEPVRMPEPLEIPTDFPSFEAPEGMSVDLSDLGIGSDEPLTRRQIREFERLTGSDIQEEPVSTATSSFEVRLPYDDDLVEQVPELANTNALEVIEADEAPNFAASPGMVIEPVTNSIVIDQVQDLSNYTSTINSTGEILTTGAIQIPVFLPESDTGEVKIIEQADALDAAIQADNAAGFINSVAPVRVTGIVGILGRSKVIPTNLRKGRSQPFMVLATAVLIILAGATVVTLFMLK
ncbi:MAG: hypothetical protein ACKOWJ_02635 [Micrococcales bacterium]